MEYDLSRRRARQATRFLIGPFNQNKRTWIRCLSAASSLWKAVVSECCLWMQFLVYPRLNQNNGVWAWFNLKFWVKFIEKCGKLDLWWTFIVYLCQWRSLFLSLRIKTGNKVVSACVLLFMRLLFQLFWICC